MSLPHEDFVYLGDTARFPYGPRTPERAARLRARARASILARPTARSCSWSPATRPRAAALPALRARAGRRGAGRRRRRAGVAAGGAATRNGEVGLLATPATVASGAYERALAEAAPDARLHAVACPELAPLIQAGGEVDERVVEPVERALRAAARGRRRHGDPRLHPLSARPPRCSSGRSAAACELVSSGQAIADEVEAGSPRRGSRTTRATPRRLPLPVLRRPGGSSGALGTRFLQLPIGEVEHVDVAPRDRGRAA